MVDRFFRAYCTLCQLSRNFIGWLKKKQVLLTGATPTGAHTNYGTSEPLFVLLFFPADNKLIASELNAGSFILRCSLSAAHTISQSINYISMGCQEQQAAERVMAVLKILSMLWSFGKRSLRQPRC